MVQCLFLEKKRNVKSDQYTAEEVPAPLRPCGTIYEINIHPEQYAVPSSYLTLSQNTHRAQQKKTLILSVYSCAIWGPNVHYECRLHKS